MNRVDLKYGTGKVAFPAGNARILEANPVRLEEPGQTIRRALSSPVGAPVLAEICRAGDRVVIVTSDITRYTGSEIYLPILVEELNRAGVRDEDIEVVIALGIHRKQSDTEHRKILGPLYDRIRVSDHECDDPTALTDLGTTSTGMPVQVNSSVLAADRIIATGTVGLHYFAGFGGGRKSLVPGVASRQTCMATHFAIFNPPEIGGKHPKAAPGILEGNPVHEAILEAARMLEPDFSLNTVLTPEKDIFAAFAGELNAAHLAACETSRGLYLVEIDEAADLAVISCGGYPKDINMIQSQKALDYGVRSLKPGGTAILLAACPDGFGNPTFFDWFRHRDLDEFEAALRQNYEINGQTAHSILEKARRYRVILVSGFSREVTETMGMEKADSLDQALEMAYEKLPPDPDTVIIPDGGTILPVVKSR